ncbi:sigma-70 family RNA polymerase sigma factor [Hymenobacter sp. BT770]|uniref:RNA polymerase sigma factor n=1 Tax=Hymenobacter sp. BT770 TaxID=2886942 RepID=UPI001D1287E8|nr:sigma-70 family RNA polymerase sigma factor [Hymenobacter sp. BT770]MCC3153395.1 sigma-70 family RNA polymerase sigma factor [Hymenobacter sp. BT770]MDO3415523.1 sigma-70 family RNA polymerase sigma factor [Hymenobacter sp. BT770]
MSTPMTTSFLPPPATPAATLRQELLANRERALTQLYRRAFPLVRRHVQRHSGSAQDAQDVFHDALLLLYEQAVGGTLELRASASTYLVGISRNLWHHELRRRARHPLAPLEAETAQLVADAPDATAETAAGVLDYVERLGEKCKSILLSFYYFGQPLEQIAAAHQYRSVRSATVQKFKCLERLRQAVRAVASSETITF